MAIIALGIAIVCQTLSKRRFTVAAWFLWALESAIVFCLVLTYSRSALLGLTVAHLVVFLFARVKLSPLIRYSWLQLGFRFLLIVLSVWLSGMSDRVHALGSDASVSHRLIVWQGGLSLVKAAPFSGCGMGNSGWLYMNWVQPLTASTGYRSLMSTPLTLIAELGIPAGVALLSLPFGALFLICGMDSQDKCCAISQLLNIGVLSLVAIYGLTNTITISNAGAWLLIGFLIIGALIAFRRPIVHWHFHLKLIGLYTGILGLLVTFSFAAQLRPRPFAICHGVVTLNGEPTHKRPIVWLFPDQECFREPAGKVVRAAWNGEGVIHIYMDAFHTPTARPGKDTKVFLFGRLSAYAQSFSDVSDVVLVNPLTRLPEAIPNVKILLGEYAVHPKLKQQLKRVVSPDRFSEALGSDQYVSIAVLKNLLNDTPL